MTTVRCAMCGYEGEPAFRPQIYYQREDRRDQRVTLHEKMPTLWICVECREGWM